MRKKLSLLLVMALVLTLCGCNSSKQNNTSKADDDKIEIGFTLDTFVMERWERDRDIFISRANELGAEVNVQSANGDIEEQRKQVKYFIDQGVDVIVIVPIDCNSLAEEVQMAKDAGIKVISYDRLIQDAPVDLYITFDNTMVGTLMGESLANVGTNDKRIIMVSGPTTDSNVIMVDAGFTSVVEEKGYKIIDTTYIENWKQNLAYDYINDNIDKVKEANVIMCGNDALAGQVILALLERNMVDDYIIIGQDADLDACQRIVEGTQYLTIYKPISELATSAADCAVKLAKDEELSYTARIQNGSQYINYIGLRPYQVNKDNMDKTVIDEGFHRREDVYLNVKNSEGDSPKGK